MLNLNRPNYSLLKLNEIVCAVRLPEYSGINLVTYNTVYIVLTIGSI